MPVVRRYRPDDFDAVNDLWRRARLDAVPDFQARKGHTAEEDRAYFRNVVLVKNDVWVLDVGGRPAAFMAIAGDFIDQLYVDPGHQRRGLGTVLLTYARTLSPAGLRLYTLQVNTGAQAFYAKRGFVLVRAGVSPPPESEPDLEYHWRP